MSNLGSNDNPFTHAPQDWDTNGLPYGALCECSRCGLVGRSTITFDFYAKGPGVPLTCENCERGGVVMDDACRKEFEGKIFEEPKP